MGIDYNKIKAITGQVVKEYNGYTLDVVKSGLSSSVYVYIHFDGAIVTLRISDHYNNCGVNYDEEMVANKVNVNTLRRTLESLCKKLKRKRVKYLLRLVASQLKEPESFEM